MRARKAHTAWTLALCAALFLAAPVRAEEPGASGTLDPAQEDAIRNVVRQYLLENPEVLIEALQVYRERQQQAEQARVRQTLAERQEELARDPDTPVMGNPEGDVVVVEFFDYRCPYCIRVASPLRQTVEADGNVRLVMKEYPILGPESVTAARMALAAARQDKYEEIHTAFMAASGELDEARAFALAEDVGLDMERLRRDMQAPEIDRMLERNAALAQALQINGTPAFVIGDELIRGAIDMATFRQIIGRVRAKSS